MNRVLLQRWKNIFSFKPKNFATCIYNEEYTVSPFCSLFITCPYNVKIRPLDVHKYPDCDKLIVKLYSDIKDTKPKVTCIHDDTKFNIFGEGVDDNPINCFIQTPVKSGINVMTTNYGHINVKKINGEKILLQSELGDIITNNCQTTKISYSSKGGNITTLGTLHAADIHLETNKNSKIVVNHLQALKAKLVTEEGDITVKSSYCDDTTFKTKTGNLFLDNIHKNCTILIVENGLLQMTGFDGTLNVDVLQGDIDIQASKLYDKSKIILRSKNNIFLRLSDWIQDNTEIKTTCQEFKVSDDVKLAVENKQSYILLSPKNSKITSGLEVTSALANVIIETSSWANMLKMKGFKSSD